MSWRIFRLACTGDSGAERRVPSAGSSTTTRLTGPGRIADELASADPRVHVLHRDGKRGLGTAYVARLQVGARTRLRVRVRDGLRLLARSGGSSAPARVAGEAQRRGGGLTVVGDGGTENWSLLRDADQPWRFAVRQDDPRRAGQRSHQRLQVLLNQRAAQGSTWTRWARMATPSR